MSADKFLADWDRRNEAIFAAYQASTIPEPAAQNAEVDADMASERIYRHLMAGDTHRAAVSYGRFLRHLEVLEGRRAPNQY